MEEVRSQLGAVCREDGDRTRAIFAHALPSAEVTEAVTTCLAHVRAIPDALLFIRQQVSAWEACGLERALADYLTEPMDPEPETLYGAYGYLDDAYLVVGAAMCVDEPHPGRWGGLDEATTESLRARQERVRRLLHPDVAALQDTLLLNFRALAEEARRQAAARRRFSLPRRVRTAAAMPCRGRAGAHRAGRLLGSLPGVYASLL